MQFVLARSFVSAVSLWPIKAQLLLGQFNGKAAPAEDPDGKVEPLGGVWLDKSARQLPVLGETVGSDEWPDIQYQEDEQKQHGNIDSQQPAGGLVGCCFFLLHWLSCC